MTSRVFPHIGGVLDGVLTGVVQALVGENDYLLVGRLQIGLKPVEFLSRECWHRSRLEFLRP